MTRWARSSDSNKKRPHDGTNWADMFSNGINSKAENDDDKSRLEKKQKKKERRQKKEKHLKKLEGVTKVKKKFKGDSKSGKVNITKSDRPWKVSESDGDKSKQRAIRNQFFKDKRSEERRVQRKHNRDKFIVCFNCRNTGHRLDECPKLKGSTTQGMGICFKCGSTEHKSSACSTKVAPGEYPYAKCFICGEMGHITRQCPDNPRGLYPKGGCCKECGSVEHFKRDCPDLQKKQGEDTVTVEKINSTESADAELDVAFQFAPKKKKGGGKVVKF